MSHTGPSRPPDRSRPCWTCHWYAYVTPGYITAACLNPACSGSRAQPEFGCAAWMREPGADDEPGATWSPAHPHVLVGRQHIEWAAATRARLQRILAMSDRARLPAGVYVKVLGLCGRVDVASYGRWPGPAELASWRAELERLGLNAAVNAGRL